MDSKLWSALIEAAERHGSESEPDHEIGDLQDLLNAALSSMSPAQVAEFSKSDTVKELLQEWGDGCQLLHQEPFKLTDDDDNVGFGYLEIGDDVKIVLAGHSNGVFNPEAGAQPIVCLELWEGKPRLIVHADYNSEEPTHTIDLSTAKAP